MNLNENILKKLCRCLREYDPNIIEIVQFGSSVYAPKFARDVDLVVFTEEEKDYGGYLDCLDELGLSYDVDIVVKVPDQLFGENFAQQITGSYRIIYGNGECLKMITKSCHNPQLGEAWTAIQTAKEHITDAEKKDDQNVKDRYIRNAFNELFHAARIASMIYSSIEESRWGQIKKMLPRPYRKEFEKFITALHVKYFYHGLYPKDRVKEEFAKWHQRVKAYVKKLEQEVTNKERER